MRYKSYAIFIFLGMLIVIGTLLKLLGVMDFSSDWFWFLAGAGVVVEGISSLQRQRRLDKQSVVPKQA